MNDQQLEKKVRQDADKVKKDLGNLVKDSAARFSRFGDDVGHANGKATKDLTAWVEETVAQLSKGFEKVSDDAKKTVEGAAAVVKKDVGHGLSEYNAKVQDVADQVPDGFAKRVAKYPWVAISIGLAIGFLLGIVIKPTRQA